ncbi:MAG: ABC transporter substrate-binding protein [Candidatus Cloacimonas sp.]|jgi:polar amino acid transport system substrate-binding protein|nr:ABC transporter substrate-binding protein [Candidatus Cloacimonas sp.]
MKVYVKVAVVMMLAVVMLAGISACGKKSPKVLRIGTNAEYPPFESKEGESFVGVDIDLARRIAQKLDMEFKIIDMDFDTLIPSLGSNKIDLALSAITINDERMALVDFSQPYYVGNQVIIAHPMTKLKLDKLDDIVKYKVGALNSSTGQKYMIENYIDKKLMPTENLKKYPTNIEAITDMLAGNIDFVIIDDSAAQGYSKMKPIGIVQKIETNESYGIAMPKGGALNEKINAALQELIDGGEIASIIQTHIR